MKYAPKLAEFAAGPADAFDFVTQRSCHAPGAQSGQVLGERLRVVNPLLGASG